MTINTDDKTWVIGVDLTVSGGRHYSDPAKAPGGGSLAHGGSLVITGTGFGTKASAAPQVYDNFESGTVGQLVFGNAPVDRAIGGAWVWDDYTSGTERPKYSSDYSRGVSTKAAKMVYTGSGGYNNSLEIFKDFPNSGDELYLSFWYRYERTSGQCSRNHKPFVLYGSDGGVFPEAYVGWGNPDFGDGGLRNSAQDSGATDPTIWASGPDMSGLSGKWRRFEAYLKQSTPATSDGAWQMWSHDPDAAAVIALVMNDTTYKTRSSSNYWRQIQIGSYHDNQTANGQPYNVTAAVYLGEVYVDTTRARVEIGDNATYASCKRREIQPATAWSNTSVTIRANKGGFATSSTGYVFVIDSTGAAQSAGTVTWS